MAKSGKKRDVVLKKGKKNSAPKNNYLIAAILATILVAGVVVFYSFSDKNSISESSDSIGGIVASVNGGEITAQDVEDQKNLLLQQTGQQADNNLALENIIIQRLLLEEADKRGITSDKEEVETMIGISLAMQGATLDDLKENLVLLEMDYDKFINQYIDHLKIIKLSKELVGPVEVSESEALAFYQENDQLFQQPDGSTISFDDVKTEIKEFLKQNSEEEVFGRYMIDLRENADVEIYDQVYS
jgi:parvulin-like peptidyl-prolyl isomerase